MITREELTKRMETTQALYTHHMIDDETALKLVLICFKDWIETTDATQKAFETFEKNFNESYTKRLEENSAVEEERDNLQELVDNLEMALSETKKAEDYWFSLWQHSNDQIQSIREALD